MGFALQRLLSNGYMLDFWISCLFLKRVPLMDSVGVLIDGVGSQVIEKVLAIVTKRKTCFVLFC